MANADERLAQAAVDQKYNMGLKKPMVALNSNLMALKNEYVAIRPTMNTEDQTLLDAHLAIFITNAEARIQELKTAAGVV